MTTIYMLNLSLNYNIRKKVTFTKPQKIENIIKRSMLATATTRTSLTRHTIMNMTPTRLKTITVVKLKKKSNAAKDLATDDTGKHSHAVNNICEKNNCESKQCEKLCDQLKSLDSNGFFTHKPIAGKYCRFICNHDANKQEDAQYFIKNRDKTKQITAAKIKEYYNNKEIKEDKKMQQYIQDNNLYDKITH